MWSSTWAIPGRIENAQVGVLLGYASCHGRALIDRALIDRALIDRALIGRALHVPKEWASDAPRRRKARIPGNVELVATPKQGLAMLERARVAGVPFPWVAGDSVHGADSAIRRWAERHRCGYVLAVTSGQRLGQRPVTDWIEGLAADAWHRLSAGNGAKGPRLYDCPYDWAYDCPYDWAYLPCSGAAEGFACAVLVRRSIADPKEVTFYLAHAPHGAALAELVRVAGTRWTIESLFEQAKGEVGLDQYEVRSWIGWRRHITLSMLALAYLAVVRHHAGQSAETGAVGGCGPGKPHPGPAAAYPCPRPGASSRHSCFTGHPGPAAPCNGQPGANATSNAPNAPIGINEHSGAPEKPGCSTRPASLRRRCCTPGPNIITL